MTESRVTDDMRNQTAKNLELIGRFLAEELEHGSADSEQSADIPLVLVPTDDESLARSNFELALRAADRGLRTRLHLVGRQKLMAPAWEKNDLKSIQLSQIRPHFPQEKPAPSDIVIVYDKRRDALLVDFFGGRRRALVLPVNEYAAVRIDPDTHDLIGYLLVSFLQVGAMNSPVLASALRKAEFRPITEEELGGIKIQGSDSPLSENEALAVVTEITRLIA